MALPNILWASVMTVSDVRMIEGTHTWERNIVKTGTGDLDVKVATQRRAERCWIGNGDSCGGLSPFLLMLT